MTDPAKCAWWVMCVRNGVESTHRTLVQDVGLLCILIHCRCQTADKFRSKINLVEMIKAGDKWLANVGSVCCCASCCFVVCHHGVVLIANNVKFLLRLNHKIGLFSEFTFTVCLFLCNCFCLYNKALTLYLQQLPVHDDEGLLITL